MIPNQKLITDHPSAESLPNPSWMSAASMLTLAILCLYWGLLFYATHMPMPMGMMPGNSDKFIHFVAYFGLGGLLLAYRASLGPVSRRLLLVCWLVVTVYGAFDELTQLLVNRHADVYDWVFDVTGAAAGLLTAALVHWCLRPKLRQSF